MRHIFRCMGVGRGASIVYAANGDVLIDGWATIITGNTSPNQTAL